MKDKKWMSASELMAEFQRDREFLKAESDRQEKQTLSEAAFRKSTAPILKELRERGIELSALDDLPRCYAPLSVEVAEVLLRWVTLATDEMVQEHLIRALAAFTESYDARPLIEVFESTQSEMLRWAIANTLAESRPNGITDWLLSAVRDPTFKKPREMLVLAVGRLTPREIARETLVPLFDEFPGHVALALGEFGEEQELALLRQKRRTAKGWVAKEINKAVRRISRRLNELHTRGSP